MPFPISIDEIKAAYEATGAVPVQKVYFLKIDHTIGGRPCGCALATVLAARVGVDRANDIDSPHLVADLLEIDEEAVGCFMDGFDGGEPPGPAYIDPEAYEAGKAAWAAVCPEPEVNP